MAARLSLLVLSFLIAGFIVIGSVSPTSPAVMALPYGSAGRAHITVAPVPRLAIRHFRVRLHAGRLAIRKRLRRFRSTHARAVRYHLDVRNTGVRSAAPIDLRPRALGDLFGVGAYITQRSASVSGLLVGRARLLDAEWVREEFTATRLHTSANGRYDWGPFDRVIDQERAAGLHVLGLLDYSNTWGYGDHGTMPHADMTRLAHDFARYAYAVARHYRGRVSYWQVWNEPNRPVFWHPHPNPDDYAYLLRVAYRAVKRANPRAKVVLAGLSGVDLDFLKRVLNDTRSVDILSVHPYRNEPEGELLQQVRALRQWHKPVWFSEIGWAAGHGCDTCTDDTTQASYLVRFYALAAAAGVQRIFWYDLRDDSNGASDPESHFGLMQRNLSGKPAFAAYAYLARILHRARFVAADSLVTGGIYALRFSTSHGPLEVAWNTGAGDQSVAFPWIGQSAVALGMDGSWQADVTVEGGSATVRVAADGNPLYVTDTSVQGPISAPPALLHPPPPPRRPHLRPHVFVPRRAALRHTRVLRRHTLRAHATRARGHRRPIPRRRQEVRRGAWTVAAPHAAPAAGKSSARSAERHVAVTPTRTPAPAATRMPAPTPTVMPTATPLPTSTAFSTPSPVPPVQTLSPTAAPTMTAGPMAP